MANLVTIGEQIFCWAPLFEKNTNSGVGAEGRGTKRAFTKETKIAMALRFEMFEVLHVLHWGQSLGDRRGRGGQAGLRDGDNDLIRQEGPEKTMACGGRVKNPVIPGNSLEKKLPPQGISKSQQPATVWSAGPLLRGGILWGAPRGRTGGLAAGALSGDQGTPASQAGRRASWGFKPFDALHIENKFATSTHQNWKKSWAKKMNDE